MDIEEIRLRLLQVLHRPGVDPGPLFRKLIDDATMLEAYVLRSDPRSKRVKRIRPAAPADTGKDQTHAP